MNISKNKLILLMCKFLNCEIGSITHQKVKEFVDSLKVTKK